MDGRKGIEIFHYSETEELTGKLREMEPVSPSESLPGAWKKLTNSESIQLKQHKRAT